MVALDKHLVVAAMGIAVLFGVAAFNGHKDHWPKVDIPDFMSEPTNIGLAKLAKISPEFEYATHDAAGAYISRGAGTICKPTERRPFDEDGITMLIYRDQAYYHPVNTAQCGLSAYAWHIAGNDGEASVRLHADKIISMQDEIGALRYPFAWNFYLSGEDFPVGWTSAMAQGQAMSLLARAYRLTSDEKYLEAGKKALDYLLTPVEQGGVMTTMAELDLSLDDFIFFEEYASTPASYTLNGYMFVLLGLYDWSQLDAVEGYGKSLAAEYFARGINTLKHILPYYDVGGITSYDLGYITFKKPSKVNAAYHMLHGMQLNVMYEITGEPKFKEYSERWIGYAPLKLR